MPAPSSITALVERAASLLASDPAQSESLAIQALEAAPGDPRARLILASAYRRRGALGAARDILAPLARAFPKALLTQYELGLVQADLGEAAAAMATLRGVLALKPDFAPAWKGLGDLLFGLGDLAGADAAFAEHARAAVEDPRLKPAAQAIFEGRTEAAEVLLRQHLLRFADDKPALRMMADLHARAGRLDDAEVLLAHCLDLDPDFEGARFDYANVLFRQQRAGEALPHVERLLVQAPSAALLNLKAACLALVGEDDQVLDIYAGLLAEFPRQALVWLNQGHALRTVGRAGEAEAAYRRSIALSPGLGDAYWSLANLKVASFSPSDIAAMVAQLARPDLPDEDRLHFHYALGKALEDAGQFAESFGHYALGASLRRRAVPYDPATMTREVARQAALFTPAFFAARSSEGTDPGTPLFIVGLPRSGSTLVEQILASHSAIEGTMELPHLGRIARRLDQVAKAAGGPAYPEALAMLNGGELAELGSAYMAATQAHRKLGRPLFIDKMPNNFQHIGLIQLILPQARIIDVRRHPMGVCFSAFKQHFAQGQSFSYDLRDLGLYYRDYVALMAHFDQVLPGRVHRVIYEDLVEDTEGEVARLLDHCGLPFEAQCLRFHENPRAVRTVSSEQVRRPIFRGGLEQWRSYEPWLDPLKAALGPTLEAWRGA